MSASTAVNWLWLIWYVSWIGAVVFSARTRTRRKADFAGAHRWLAGVGAVLLFLPAHPVVGRDLLGWSMSRAWTAPPMTNWSLFALVVAAFAFCWWARVHLGRLWSGLVTLKEGHRVVDSGPYALVRHPIYTGAITAAWLTAAIRATPAALVGAALLAIGFTLTARIEERFLRTQLGADAYDAYARRTPMLVPFAPS